MSVRTTRWFGVVLAVMVGAFVIASPVCALATCTTNSGHGTSMPEACTGNVPMHELHSDCSDMKKAPVVANAGSQVPVVEAVAPVATFSVSLQVAEVQVASVDPRPPDPLEASSRLRL